MPQRKLPSNVDVETAMANTLMEWGVDSQQDNHRCFRLKVLRQTRNVLVTSAHDHKLDTDDINEWPTIPADMLAAIKLNFRLEIEEAHACDRSSSDTYFYFCRDELESKLRPSDNAASILWFPPYYVGTNYKTGTFRGTKKSYTRFSALELDPLRRFKIYDEDIEQLHQMSTAELSFTLTYDSEGLIEGCAFEAIVASHAIYSEPCYHCKMRGSLRWGGGHSRSWKDMKCKMCGSCFEIKSKASQDHIEKIFKFGTLMGGSFRRWCHDEQSHRQGKDFIVLVSREQTVIRTGIAVWRVEVTEILSILPRISHTAFIHSDDESIPLSSTVFVSSVNRKLWFNIPCPDFSLDLYEVFRGVFDEIYPGEFDRIISSDNVDASKMSEVNSPKMPEVNALPNEKIESDLTPKMSGLDALRQALDSLTVDNWEDADDSD